MPDVAFWTMALLPALLIVQHALYLWMARSRFSINQLGPNDIPAYLELPWRSAKSEEEAAFSFTMLASRYGVPALLIFVLVVFWGYLLWNPPAQLAPAREALRFGAVGAYVYTMLHLGQRNFRRDITSGGAWWCAVTLLIGPLLAAVLAFIWQPQTGDKEHSWGPASFYFLAGLSTRQVASTIDEILRRLWLTAAGSTTPQARTLPLSQVRGISPLIEDRLSEEGVFDVCGLAYAEPVRLLRNTSFDPRQLLAWMDEALLMVTLPQNWQALESEGVTGAIDLAWYHEDNSAQVPAGVTELAERVNIKPWTLWGVVERLFQDAQVKLVWVLYQPDMEDKEAKRPFPPVVVNFPVPAVVPSVSPPAAGGGAPPGDAATPGGATPPADARAAPAVPAPQPAAPAPAVASVTSAPAPAAPALHRGDGTAP